MNRVSLITAIKDRAESLEAAFATWINVRGISQIIIVDWSSKDTSVIEKIARQDSRVLVARVENEIYFNHTRTKNLGINLSDGEIIVVTDADIKIHPRFRRLFSVPRFRRLFSGSNGNDKLFYRGWIPGGYGTMVVRRHMLDAVGGYDERMEGWGGSDDDLYLRLTLHGFQFAYIPERLLTHIDHSEEARHVNMSIRGRKESQLINAGIVRQHGLWSKDLYASTHKPITATLWSSYGYLETRIV
jgi:glycosyltransferase involved in cell wall biosynthesis